MCVQRVFQIITSPGGDGFNEPVYLMGGGEAVALL